MSRIPRFQPHYRVEVMENEGVFLFSEGPPVVLDGRFFRLIAPLLDGKRTVDDLVDQLGDTIEPAHVHYALSRLEKNGYITLDEEPAALPDAEAALWTSQKISPAVAKDRLDAGVVAINAKNGIDAAPLRVALEAAGLRVADSAHHLTVIVTDDYLHHDLATHNTEALKTGAPWMLVRPVGRELWIGPIFRPGKTGCWECMAHRLRGHRGVECWVREQRGASQPFAVARARSGATMATAFGIAATETATFIGSESSTLEGKVLSIDLRSWEARTHTLVRRPQCNACGQAPSGDAKPIQLESERYALTQDGGFRAHTIEATLRRYEHHVSPITGALLGLERIEVNDGVTHVYVAGPNSARARNGDFGGLRFDLRNKNSGKGTSDLAAKAGAVCEGLERYSGIFQGDEPRRTAKFRELEDAAIDPNGCMLFSAAQLANRDALNADEWRFDFVPFPFDPDARMEWSPVWSLTQKRHRYLPTSFCYFSYPHGQDHPFTVACSSGNAAGNSVAEATLQGFLELVERDAVAQWWYNRLRKPGVEFDRFDEPYLQKVRRAFAVRDREMWALDLTTDLGIPVYAAVSRRTRTEPGEPSEKIMFGFGAHLDPRIALLRAVTELNQMLAMFTAGPGGEGERTPIATDPAPTARWLRTATLADQRHLEAANGPANGPAQAHATGDLREDVLRCQALVETRGLEMLVLDQTRPDIGLSVVKVFVPGLRHFWARFAPGRLFDVPIRMGWMKEPLAEDALNPIAMFL